MWTIQYLHNYDDHKNYGPLIILVISSNDEECNFRQIIGEFYGTQELFSITLATLCAITTTGAEGWRNK